MLVLLNDLALAAEPVSKSLFGTVAIGKYLMISCFCFTYNGERIVGHGVIIPNTRNWQTVRDMTFLLAKKTNTSTGVNPAAC